MDASPPPPFPTNPQDPEVALRRNLARYRAFASGLLVLMAALMLGAYWMPPGYATDLLQAAAKAGLVGGLADWFAVTALFRRPMGLPIPHTAIIPNEKERLGRGLGRFVANHVFTEAEIGRLLARIDIAAILRRFLEDPATSRQTAEALAGSLPRLLLSVEDGRARKLLLRLLPRIASGPAAARMLARLLRTLMAGGQHQEVFGLALAQIRVVLAAKEESLRDAIQNRVRAEGGALVGWLAGAAVARRVLSSINQELEKIEPDDSELRAAFEAWLLAEIEKLENDPERAATIGRALREAMAHPTVNAWLMDVWDRLKAALAADAGRKDGRTVVLLSGLMGNLGALLEQDEGARARVNGAVERMLRGLLPQAQDRLSGFIAQVVGNWDTATVVDKIELRVGRDLQFVRVNGTLVGFLAGGALYALLRAVFGHGPG
ncbi:DUF445 family protein [Pseudoroseomonas wenyumeiae]|uniref:DUF445 domain-containing protein n=1 Tax=Teichococcus wenyumeiae TaxID=2478470 RepID=A0A3A9K0D5_9PROT|nr:DUF445 domain-containing protein [Pseudoroseomonas wenyumeiae]RKK04809.1 DUF445 domain-containing protein [Pseudoroseomonas wenyumeiae]RMI19477.1 DUF445 family protein [Pseudoroseomonas wenyumeiae]